MQATLNEGFKALVSNIFSQKEQSETLLKAFEEVVNDRATTQKLALDELKSRAIDEIKSEFVTKDFVRAEIAEVRAEIAEVRAEIASVKSEIIRWVVGLQVSSLALIIAAMKFL